MASKKHQIYLSSTQQDAELAKQLFRALRQFRVPRSLPVARHLRPLRRKRKFVRFNREQSRDFVLPKRVLTQIRNSHAIVLLCSPSGATSKWTRTELDAFYDSNPHGRVIPIVVDGDPEASFDRNPLSNPAFPENLAPRDADRWIDARMLGWEQTVPAEVIAEMLEVPVAQLTHHTSRAYRNLRGQRRNAFRFAMGCAALAALWIWHQPLNDAAKTKIHGYAENVAPIVSKVGSGFVNNLPEPPKLGNGRKKDAVADAPVMPQVEAPEPAILAVSSWMDRAETLIPIAPDQAMTWLDASGSTLNSMSPTLLVDERFRYHVLAAIAYKNAGEAQIAETHLLNAIESWAGLPADQAEKKERLAFELLRRTGPCVEWRSSALYIFNWITELKGSEHEDINRAQQLVSLSVSSPFLIDSIDGWLSNAQAIIAPLPDEPDHTKARFTMLRASLAQKNGRKEQAIQFLGQGEAALRASVDYPGTPVEQGLLAQYRLRIIRLEGDQSATATAQLERILPMLRRGAEMLEWKSWFQRDLALAWTSYADYLFSTEGYSGAADAYETAYEFVPEIETKLQVDTLLKAGCAYRYSERHDQAWNCFRMALAIIPEDARNADQVTALMGASMAAAELDKSELARLFQDRARSITTEDMPNYKPPKYWREPVAPALSS